MDFDGLPRSVPPLTRLFELGEVSAGRFRAPAMPGAAVRRYGGETAALALRAACLHLEPGAEAGLAAGADHAPTPHHAHAAYLTAADSSHPLDLQVSVLHAGRSYTTCRVDVSQDAKQVLAMTAGFVVERPGTLEFQRPLGPLTPPEDLPPEDLPDPREQYGHLRGIPEWIDRYTIAKPLEARFPSDPIRVDVARGGTARYHQQAWIRFATPVPAGTSWWAPAILYLSDAMILSTALGPHNLHLTSEGLRFATLDHTLWLHEETDPGKWLLYDMTAEWTGHERGYCTGAFYRRDGRRVASFAQQGMLRHRP